MEERLSGNENSVGGGENSVQQQQQLTEPLNCNGPLDRGDKPGYLSNCKFKKHALLAIVFLVLITIIIALTVSVVKSSNPPSAGPDPPAAARCCPDDWVGYLGRCYYFSEAEGNWNNSQSNCSSFGASLATINTQQEMAFIKRHKGLSEYWIGLRREPGQVWKWTNGTKFNHWFEVRAQGECAYLNDEAVTSSWCDTVRYWICSKPAGPGPQSRYWMERGEELQVPDLSKGEDDESWPGPQTGPPESATLTSPTISPKTQRTRPAKPRRTALGTRLNLAPFTLPEFVGAAAGRDRRASERPTSL
ncbi:antigen peptide transporter 1-like [Platysternon megacephalum]|uniref:Antigen peptide transporter 1-like n=1 Tax=Platysternon megacephalum TaxID=55544 RepID=A0A4D9DPE7_9SAUR|nr:antigen peptide transporter 1-like [Platysternon megacephalum]